MINNNSLYVTYPKIVKDMVFLKHFIHNPNISVGDYTYYHEDNYPEYFEFNNVRGGHSSKLIIGKFCQIATRTTFILDDMNHDMRGFSTYPFQIFQENFILPTEGDRRKIVIGNDVWFCTNAVIMPSVTIGDGAIIGAYSVVTKDVAPYTIVAGNSARIIRQRFSDNIIEELLTIQWWNWDYDKIIRNIQSIIGADISKLRNAM